MKNEWTEDHLVKTYHRIKMKNFVLKYPVMIALKVKVQGKVQGPIAPLHRAKTELEMLRAILDLLHDTGMKP